LGIVFNIRWVVVEPDRPEAQIKMTLSILDIDIATKCLYFLKDII
jgi:hypothetical protein